MILFVQLFTPCVYFKHLLISGHLESFLGREFLFCDQWAYRHAWLHLVNLIHLVLDTNLFPSVYYVDHFNGLWMSSKLKSPVSLHVIWFLWPYFLNLLCFLRIKFKIVFHQFISEEHPIILFDLRLDVYLFNACVMFTWPLCLGFSYIVHFVLKLSVILYP